MNDEQALLQTIRERPKDDEPRLVYADWLDEHGKSTLADFIRCKVTAARLPERDDRRREVEQQANRILQEHGEEWEDSVRQLGATGIVEYDRGLPIVKMTAQAFLEHADGLFKEHPEITGVRITDLRRDQREAILSSPHLERLTHLALSGHGVGDGGARALAESSHVRHLTHLDLEGHAISHAGAQALAASPHLRNLTNLHLGYNNIGNEGARALAGSRHLQGLMRLDLRSNGIGETGARAIAASSRFRDLTGLYLTGNNIGVAVRMQIERALERRAGQAVGRGR